jgi:hypothetical protein
MPVLHNYVMIDTNAFLSEPQRLEVVFKMIKQVNIFLFISYSYKLMHFTIRLN